MMLFISVPHSANAAYLFPPLLEGVTYRNYGNTFNKIAKSNGFYNIVLSQSTVISTDDNEIAMTLEHNNSLLSGAFVTNANGDICMIWYNYKPSDKKQKDLIVEVLTCSLLACNWNIDTARNFVEKAFSEGSAGLTANGRLYKIDSNSGVLSWRKGFHTLRRISSSGGLLIAIQRHSNIRTDDNRLSEGIIIQG